MAETLNSHISNHHPRQFSPSISTSMKFFFEFVSCCGSPTSSSSSRRPSSDPKTTPSSRTEETRSLVPSPSRRYRRRKRGRVGASGSVSVEWRPSLCVIAEDNVVVENDERAVGSEKKVKRKAQVHVRVRSRSDEYGGTPFPTVMPTFSPTPFLF